MKVAVIGSSLKPFERRVPIHPSFLESMNDDVLRNLVFETGYGNQFGYTDEKLTEYTGNRCLSRDILIANSDKVVMTKPVLDDIKQMKDGATLFGWIHSVQNKDIVDIGIEKKLTYVAWENMYYETKRGRVHLFQTNNELAGYCAVEHALDIQGTDGYYGPQKKVKIMSFGSVSRGAIHALRSKGFNDIEVYSWRPTHLIADRIHAITYSQLYFDGDHVLRVDVPGKPRLVDEFAQSDIILNGILQNPIKPVMFMTDADVLLFKKPCLIIDVSCDEGMGFPFAKPTDFANPTFQCGNITYYGVDHTPSLLWDSASYQISKGLIPYMYQFIFDNYGDVLEKAVDLRNGKIKNIRINEFQNR
ncbi:hypothetical protein G7062_04315 [Erysipelothrix sp. HDW6C]|uniref:hypothetical protein n=1 Tax=Erysipelothrix sp. HDW6C TaxID=2714930 RepID=UPI00140BDBBF|nr:hypothetical protein [Erysipelothrix sp. HDW6C]QIK69566.1 hypothetical protein G7062_04315 [Erysipelothrix sp. HDW6C]